MADDEREFGENMRIHAALLAVLPEDATARIGHLAGAIGLITLAEGFDEETAVEMARAGIRGVARSLEAQAEPERLN